MMRAIKFTSAVAVVFALTGLVRADDTKGTIKTVDTGRHEVVVKGIVKDSVYELVKDATVWLDGARAKLGDLRADDRANITYEKKGDHLMARDVRALRKTQETTGTVRSILKEKNEVIVKGLVKDTSYELNKGGTVWVNAKPATLTDLREGDEVLITYESRGDHLMAADVTVLKRK